jgi:CheY-like chemotaxis protein
LASQYSGREERAWAWPINHDVDIAENGEEAVAAVRKEDYDVVLMDVQMPVLDGVEATKQIRALPPPKGTIPIIALTAHAMAGAREEYLAAGMDDYLSKPLEPDALFAALGRASADAPRAAAARGTPEAGTVKPGANTDKLFDPVRIATLKRVLSAGEVSDFVAMFLDSLKTVADRHDQLIRANEIEDLMQEVHALAGTAGNVGAVWVSQCARDLERACKSGDAAGIAHAAAMLRHAIPETRCELERWLAAERAEISMAAANDSAVAC